MFTYQNHRVHIAGISFTIPDGCVLNWMHTEVEINGFSAFSSDRKVKFSVLPELYTKYAENPSAKERCQELMNMFTDGTYAFHTDITPIHKYGMDGFSLQYSGETVHYYDEIFDLPEMIDGIYQLQISVSASDGITMDEALALPIVREFFESIQVDE